MAHHVDITLPTRDLGRADAIFRVKRAGSTLGTLHVSKGSVVWFPRDTNWGHKLGWADFNELMRQRGSRSEKR